MPRTFFPPPTSKETASWRSRHASRHVRHARAVMHIGIANQLWRGKRSRHSRRMRNPLFYVSGKKPIMPTWSALAACDRQWRLSCQHDSTRLTVECSIYWTRFSFLPFRLLYLEAKCLCCHNMFHDILATGALKVIERHTKAYTLILSWNSQMPLWLTYWQSKRSIPVKHVSHRSVEDMLSLHVFRNIIDVSLQCYHKMILTLAVLNFWLKIPTKIYSHFASFLDTDASPWWRHQMETFSA